MKYCMRGVLALLGPVFRLAGVGSRVPLGLESCNSFTASQSARGGASAGTAMISVDVADRARPSRSPSHHVTLRRRRKAPLAFWTQRYLHSKHEGDLFGLMRINSNGTSVPFTEQLSPVRLKQDGHDSPDPGTHISKIPR